MTGYWLASAAAFAMISGVAFAQGAPGGTTETQSTTTTTNSAPVIGSYSASRTQKTIDANGNEIKKSETYESGNGGTSARSSVQTNAPDGSSMNTYRREQSSTTTGNTTTTTKTINQ